MVISRGYFVSPIIRQADYFRAELQRQIDSSACGFAYLSTPAPGTKSAVKPPGPGGSITRSMLMSKNAPS
jgi:hypothetical protein